MTGDDPQSLPTGAAERPSRSPVYLMAAIETDEGSVAVKLRNISAGGALVQGEDIPAVGTIVTFRRNGIATEGEIAWRDVDFAGIRFDGAVQPEKVLRTIKRPPGIPDRPELYRRPGLRVRELSEGERKWALRWAVAPAVDRPGD